MVFAVQDAERDAQCLAEEAWMEDSSTFALPVDPARVAHALGLTVFIVDMKAGASGALRMRADQPAEIFLNRSDSHNRQRFTCAHELGHFFNRRAEGDLDYDTVDYSDERARTGLDAAERYANAFAAALLMPKDQVLKLYPRESVAQMAQRFEVSEQAMSFRTMNLGLARA